MIPLLRAGAFLANALLFGGVSLLLGASPFLATAIAVALFLLCAWGCRRLPAGRDAPAEVWESVREVAARMGSGAPRVVRIVPGWTAGALLVRGGYGLVLGEEVAPQHREALVAHEIAHLLLGDLFWEPLTDGPARLLLESAHRVPLFFLPVFPFLLFAVPLARATELAADRKAAAAICSYPVFLKELVSIAPPGESLLYPSLAARIRHAARHSSGLISKER